MECFCNKGLIIILKFIANLILIKCSIKNNHTAVPCICMQAIGSRVPYRGQHLQVLMSYVCSNICAYSQPTYFNTCLSCW